MAVLIAAALKSRALLRSAFDGRPSQTEEEAAVSRFDMKAEMTKAQTQPRISGWLSVLSSEDVAVRSERGMLCGQVFPPLSGDPDAPWAILFHGGAGTDGRNSDRTVSTYCKNVTRLPVEPTERLSGSSQL